MLKYVILRYFSSHFDSGGAVLFIAVFGRGNTRNSRIYLLEQWQNAVLSKDQSYLMSCFAHWKTLAESNPEELLQAVSSLSVGPLRTDAEGTDSEEVISHLASNCGLKLA